MSTRKEASSRVESSPDESRELKTSVDALDTEAILRQKLLKKQQEKAGVRHASDDEEMFTMQPGGQESRKREAFVKADHPRRTREEEDRDRQTARERERANRKPIHWEDTRDSKERDHQRSHANPKRHSKDNRPSDRLSPSVHRRDSPLKRKLDEPRDARTEKSSDNSRQNNAQRDRHHHRYRQEKRHRACEKSGRRTPELPRRDGGGSSLVSGSRRWATTTGDLAPSRRDGNLSSTVARREPTLVSQNSEGSRLYDNGAADGEAAVPLLVTERVSGSSDEEEDEEAANFVVGSVTPPDALPTSADEEVEPGEVSNVTAPSTPHLSAVSTPSSLTEAVHSSHGEPIEHEEDLPAAYKKSRFESSPEMEDDGDISFGDEFSDDGHIAHDPMDVDDLDESIVNLSELERKNFDELTDEDKARLSPDTLGQMEKVYQQRLIARLPVYYPGISGCRNVNEFECVNRIEEGTFGVVFRAVEKKTDEMVALKRLKMENELNGFPITSLREINMLLKCGGHPNIVNLREIVVGSNMDKIYLVMEYVDHDMKALMETMSKKGKRFTMGQVKTLMQQLLSGVRHLHQEYVIHRDLKTSNLLLTRNGILKIGDFGLAREYGDPLKPYTPIVVTLWYRSPELLLGVKEYSTAVDMWSVGCIFAEFLLFKPLFPGRGEIDQLNKIFTEVGTPNEKIWPGYSKLLGVVKFAFVNTPYNQLRKKFKDSKEAFSDEGFELLNRLLAVCPVKRRDAKNALSSNWFLEDPQPVDPSLFPTWPSKSDAFSKDKPQPTAAQKMPPGLNPAQLKLMEDLKVDAKHIKGDGGFSLKFDVAKF